MSRQNRGPARRVTGTHERQAVRGGREWADVIEHLECGHEFWSGIRELHKTARVRYCTECRDADEEWGALDDYEDSYSYRLRAAR